MNLLGNIIMCGTSVVLFSGVNSDSIGHIGSCPYYSQFNFRQKAVCDENEKFYICVEDLSTGSYIELCKEQHQIQRPGYKVVLNGNFDSKECNESYYYQPFTFNTLHGSECHLKQSSCNEEGQMEATVGTPKTDRKCRCDHSKGYAFVNKPKDSCYCKPSEEDCSCYRKYCPVSQKLMADYTCKKKNEFPENCQYFHTDDRYRISESELESNKKIGDECICDQYSKPSLQDLENDKAVFWVMMVLMCFMIIGAFEVGLADVLQIVLTISRRIKHDDTRQKNDIKLIIEMPNKVSRNGKQQTVAVIGRTEEVNITESTPLINFVPIDPKELKNFVAVLLLMKIDDFTAEDNKHDKDYETLQQCVLHFGKKTAEHVILVFVISDKLNKINIEEYLLGVPELRVLIEPLGIKYLVCNSNSSQETKQQTKKEIVKTIESWNPVKIVKTTINELEELYETESNHILGTESQNFMQNGKENGEQTMKKISEVHHYNQNNCVLKKHKDAFFDQITKSL